MWPSSQGTSAPATVNGYLPLPNEAKRRGYRELYFTDERPFLDLDLRTGYWFGSYLCSDDHYQIETFVPSHDVVQEHWRARAPAKDYDAVTTMPRTSLPRPVPPA
jgi:hypothetical protein